MKKMISYALFASMALFASCSQDETLEQVTNAPGVLSFTTTLPNDGVQTKAADAGVKRYIMQLYYNNGTGMTTAVLNPEASEEDYSGQATMTNADGNFALDGAALGLEEGTEYTAVFWADYNAVDAESPTYDARWLTDVSYKGNLATTPMTMAYCGRQTFTYGEMLGAYTITLTRAVAQINLIQNTEFTPQEGDHVYVNYTHYNDFNALKNEVEMGNPENDWNTYWPQNATISLTATPIAANTTLGSILTFASGDGLTSNFSFYYNTVEAGAATNVPLQANYQTNIKGNYHATTAVTSATFSVITNDAWNDTDKEDAFDTPVTE